MNKILIINTFGIGDVLFSTPLVKAIKNKYPNASITYICNRRSEGILKNNPNVSDIHVYEKDEYRDMWRQSRIKCIGKIASVIITIRRERYDAMIDMSLGYIFSMVLALFTGIPMRIGFNYRNRGRFLTHKINIEGFSGKHVIEYYLELGGVLGVEPSDKEMQLVISDEDARWADNYLNGIMASANDKICGIIPGCGASWGEDAYYRRWSTWKFAEVSDYLASRYKYKILIFGEAKEVALCAKVRSEMKADASLLCGKTTLGQFAALLNKCDLVLTNDGGPMHMAVALKRNTVSIFGPVDEQVYGAYPVSSRNIMVMGNVKCRPCYRNFKHEKCGTLDCLKDVGVDKVIKAIETLVGQNR